MRHLTTNRLAAFALGITVAVALIHVRAELSYAYADAHFCNVVVQPGGICGGTMAQANWRRVRTRYPGSQTITACVYMYNYKLEQYRGGVYCGSTSDSNPFGKDFGLTSELSYRSFNQLPGTVGPHTLSGWTCRDDGGALCPG